MRFEGKVVVITGASAGIGEAAARRFAAEGAWIVPVARGAERLEAVAASLRTGGARVHPIVADVGDPADCARIIEETAAAFGRIDVLVNNAGMHFRGPFADKDPAGLAAMVDVNLRSPVLLIGLALSHLRETRGAIDNVASLAGRVPLAGSATYSATKFGLRALSLALHEELASLGVRVSVVSPGPVDTGFIRDELHTVSDLTLSQPMSTADQVAAAVVDCAWTGEAEVAMPRVSGWLTTLGYVWPGLSRALRPLMIRRGRAHRARLTRGGA